MDKFELNILGCGSATSTMRHLPSCQVINYREQLMMIDCGEGAQLELRRYKLPSHRLRHIFISHLHGDHCFGMPGLISTLALLGHTGPLTVHTFADGAEQLRSILAYFCREIPFELTYNIITRENNVLLDTDSLRVTTFPLRHGIPAVGFRFDEKPKLRHIRGDVARYYQVPNYKMNEIRRGADFVTADGRAIPNKVLTTDADPSVSYAYASDTMPSEQVVEAVRGVDWLYHEATYADDCKVQAHQRHHSTARQAAQVAAQAGVGNLIIGHYSKRYHDESVLLSEAQEEFANTRLANEGLCIDLAHPTV